MSRDLDTFQFTKKADIAETSQGRWVVLQFTKKAEFLSFPQGLVVNESEVLDVLAGDDTILGFGSDDSDISGILNFGTIYAGDGNDDIVAIGGRDAIYNTGTIDTGNGNDTISGKVEDTTNSSDIENDGKIFTGDGDDIIIGGGQLDNDFGAIIDTGSGNDKIIFNQSTQNPYRSIWNDGLIDTGSGCDIIDALGGGFFGDTEGPPSGEIKLGDGEDTLKGFGTGGFFGGTGTDKILFGEGTYKISESTIISDGRTMRVAEFEQIGGANGGLFNYENGTLTVDAAGIAISFENFAGTTYTLTPSVLSSIFTNEPEVVTGAGSKLIILGDKDDSGSDLWKYDFDNNTLSKLFDLPKDHGLGFYEESTILIETNQYILLEEDFDDGNPRYIYDKNSGTVSEINASSIPERHEFTERFADDKLIYQRDSEYKRDPVTGSYSISEVGEIGAFDLKSGSFFVLTTNNDFTNEPEVVTGAGSKLIVLGDKDDSGSDLWKYDFDNNTLSKLFDLPKDHGLGFYEESPNLIETNQYILLDNNYDEANPRYIYDKNSGTVSEINACSIPERYQFIRRFTDDKLIYQRDSEYKRDPVTGSYSISEVGEIGAFDLKSGTFSVLNVNTGKGTPASITGNGAFKEGVTLTAPVVTGDPDGDATNPNYAYQWFKGSTAITNATASTYTVPASGAGTYKVAVTYTDAQGFTATVGSPEQIITASNIPAYTISTPSTLSEGAVLTTRVATTKVKSGTTLYYSLSGAGITADDFSKGALSGSAKVDTKGAFQIVHTIQSDLKTEGDETLNIKLFSDSKRSVQVGSTASVSISDTSTLPLQVTFNGTKSADTLTGNSANNTISGLGGADILTGAEGSDTFKYALKDSLLSGYDKITDFAIGMDKIDGPKVVSTSNLKELGAVASLDQSGISAVLSNANFTANGAATFSFSSGSTTRTFLALNDTEAGFSSATDAIIEITGYSGSLTGLAII